MKPTKVIALDVGEARIGVAAADSATKLAYPLMTVAVDGAERTRIAKLLADEAADVLVIGYPRNQQGEPTAQTEYVTQWAADFDTDVLKVFQDESLTSVSAEQYLRSRGKPYDKADIDAYAAAIILTDYIESHYA